MAKNRLELLLHPIRLRIIQTLLGGRQHSAQEISEQLHDVPRTTLYRQIKHLYENKVIKIVRQQQVRGALETFYELEEGGQDIPLEQMLKMSPEEHSQLFSMFLAKVLFDFETYISKEDKNILDDGVSYRQVILHVNDQELSDLRAEMNQTLLKYLNREHGAGRRSRALTTIFIPLDKQTDQEHVL